MDIDPIQKLCQGHVRIYISLPVPSLFSLVISEWEIRKQHRAEPLHGHEGSFPSGSKYCRCYSRCCHNKSNYSESDYRLRILEDPCCCRRSIWSPWHMVYWEGTECGPWERCSVVMQTTALLRATAVTFAMPKVWLLLLFPDRNWDFYFRQAITRTSPISPMTAFAETYGKKSEKRDSTWKSGERGRKKKNQDWFL